jgi:hypothetical protein
MPLSADRPRLNFDSAVPDRRRKIGAMARM